MRQIINYPPFFLPSWGRGKKTENSVTGGGTKQHCAAEAQPYLHTECSGNCLSAVFCVYALFIGLRSLSTACHSLRLSKLSIRSSSRWWLINLRRKRNSWTLSVPCVPHASVITCIQRLQCFLGGFFVCFRSNVSRVVFALVMSICPTFTNN